MKKMSIRSAASPTKPLRWKRCAVIWLGVCALAAAGLLAYAESRAPLRSRSFRLRHIDSDAMQMLLERLDIGTEYNALSSEVIIVTSDRAGDLLKATSVVTLADRADLQFPVEFRPLMVASDAIPAPDREELAVRLRSLTLGSLLSGPPSNAPNPAIVDTVGNTLIAVASADILEQLDDEIEAWKAEHSPPPVDEQEPDEQARPSLEEIAKQLFEDEPAPAEPPAGNDEQLTEDIEDPQLVDVEQDIDTPAEQQPHVHHEPAADATRADDESLEADDDEPERTATDQPEPDGDRALLEALQMLARREQDVLAEAEQDEAPTVTEEVEQTDEPTPQPPFRPDADGRRIVTEPMLPAHLAEEELELTITLPEEVEVEALVELVGKQLGLNYMYDPAILRNQKVMLKIHDGQIRMKDLYSLLESVLRFRGFVMTRRDRLVTIVRQDQAATLDPILRLPDDPILPGDVVVSSVFELQHIGAESAKNMLGQMRLGSEIITIAETGTLVVTDYAFRMERVREVIAMIDVAGAPKDFQYRQIKFMEAMELVPKVESLASEIRGVTITVAGQPAAAAPQRRVDPETGRPVPMSAAERAREIARRRAEQQRGEQPERQRDEAAGEGIYLEADGRTNRVLMIGYPSELEIVNQLIDSLDVPGYDLRFIQEYVIKNVEAVEVVNVLNELGVAQVAVTTQQPTRRGQPQPQREQDQESRPQPQQRQTGTAGSRDPSISLRAATNSLLVNATEEQHKAIELVITHVDVLQQDQRTIQEYEIQYIDTQTVLETLADLGIISPQRTQAATGTRTTDGRQSGRTEQQGRSGDDPRSPMPTTLPGLGGDGDREITAAEPQIAVLPATNSLLVYATPRQHASIGMVIAHADRQLDRMRAPYMVYALENQDPEELADILNRLIQETIDEAADGARTEPDARIQTRQTGMARLPSGEEQRIRIVPDPKTYSLIVYANQRNQQWVGELIRELDEYRPQVLLDVTLVEITKDDAFQFQLDMIAKTFGGTMQTGWTVGEGYDFTSRNLLEARSRGGSGDIFFSSDKVQALLNIVEDRGYGRVMAKPKLLVNDNQEGEISTETTKSIAQVRTNVVPPTATTGPTTTSDVVFQDYVQGVNLAIRPHISKGNMLRLEIAMNRTDFGDDVTVEIDEVVSDGQGGLRTLTRKVPGPPDRLATDIFTTATVPDGATIILGGLERLSQTKVHSKVPLLGDLPLLGGLFRSINNVDDQSRMYIFVKAEILRPADQVEGLEDMRRVSEHNRRQFEELERRFQNMQSWPGIKDRPMQPERVLDDGMERR